MIAIPHTTPGQTHLGPKDLQITLFPFPTISYSSYSTLIEDNILINMLIPYPKSGKGVRNRGRSSGHKKHHIY